MFRFFGPRFQSEAQRRADLAAGLEAEVPAPGGAGCLRIDRGSRIRYSCRRSPGPWRNPTLPGKRWHGRGANPRDCAGAGFRRLRNERNDDAKAHENAAGCRSHWLPAPPPVSERGA